MNLELNILGVYVPQALVCAVLAWALFLALRWLLDRTAFYSHVWHPALFNLALYVLAYGVTVAAFGAGAAIFQVPQAPPTFV